MYKKSINWLSIIFFILFFTIFGFLFYFIIFSKELEYVKKIELCIETGGMFFTSFALILTYNSLKNEKQQKHFANQPYLVLNDIDFAINHINKEKCQLDFDFSIMNKGKGIANRINVKIINKFSGETLFNRDYPKLDIVDNSIAPLLANIRDEINRLNSNKSLSYGPYFNESLSDEFYIDDYKSEDEYKNLIVEIVYYDIYGKKYKGTFDAVLDEEFDLKDYEEELKEY